MRDEHFQVMFASVHLSHVGFYPDHNIGVEGSVPGMKNIVSVPLQRGTKSAEFRSAVTKCLLSRVAEFKPDLILVSAGFDGHKDDFQGNGGGLQLVDEDYGWITQQLVDIANKYSQVAPAPLRPCAFL
jgi:acetoin utilization deacetylase AcuC-like enzyme